MKSAIRFVIFLLCVGFSASARADVDQHCLSLCKANGGSSPACLATCEYGQQTQAPVGSSFLMHPQSGTGKVFAAPVPSGDLLLPKPQKSQPPEQSKDYVCVKECLQNGGQYNLCNDHCVRSDCPVGSVKCQDLRGTAPASGLPGTPPANPGAPTSPANSH